MLTDNEILGLFFKIINVSDITTLISGMVWIGEKPVDRSVEDIVINMLNSKPDFNGELHTGYVNVNCFTKANEFHTRDAARIDTITDAVLIALDIVLNEGHSGALHYRLESQKTLRDYDDPTMYYSNIKLKFSHKN
jgi:hypothetical protein